MLFLRNEEATPDWTTGGLRSDESMIAKNECAASV